MHGKNMGKKCAFRKHIDEPAETENVFCLRFLFMFFTR